MRDSGHTQHEQSDVDSQVATRDETPARVLHVDDEPSFAEMTATYLERQSAVLTVEAETDPTVALARLTEGDASFDAVLADYDMPQLDGLALYERLGAAGCDLPYVLYTGNGSEDIASRAISAGVTDYIQKQTGTDHYARLANTLERVTADYRTRSVLTRNERYFQQLVDSAPVPITMYDSAGRYLYANAAAVAFFDGEDRADVVGRSKHDVLAPAEHAAVDRRLERLAAGESVPPLEHAYTTLADAHRTGIVSCGPAVLHETATGVSIIRDISARREAATPLDDVANIVP